jgi:aryl-alcohol dehydrogenase-like predicted oxidoreductase
MKYRQLGSTKLKVSVIGIGTWQLGGEWGKTYTQQAADAILDQAKASGINLIDTAECYGDHTSESLIGSYIERGRREDWVIATKFGHQFHEHMNRSQCWSPQEVAGQLEASLRALRTDYIDVYQFHSGTDEAFDQEELWNVLSKQVEAGKIRHLGTSIGSNDNLYQTEKSTQVGSEVIQVIYNRLDRKPEEQVFPSCTEQNLGVLARVPLASGYLSGKYKPGAVFAANDVRSSRDQEKTMHILEEAARIQQNEVPEGINMATWALAWCLKHPAVTSVIPGCKNAEQVVANAAAAQYISNNHPQSWKSDKVI